MTAEVVYYLPPTEQARIASRAAYSFDITQPDPRGLVLIDACVPMSLAIDFMNMVALCHPEKIT